MEKFLIEVPHESDRKACEHAIALFQQSGSHFLSHAEWGCKDNEHKAWIIVEVENRAEAMLIVPPLFRHEAKIVRLVTFASKEMMEADTLHA